MDPTADTLTGLPQVDVAARYYRPILVPAPSAGVDWSLTVPGGFYWRLESLDAVLTTSAAVANRIPHLCYTDGSNEWYRSGCGGSLVASTAYRVCAGPSASVNTDGAAGRAQQIVTLPLILQSGYVVKMVTTALDAADQWSSIVLYVCEFRTGGQLQSEVLRTLPSID